MRCQLCSYEFDESQMICHASCAFNKYCTIICCPNCGHQMVDESKSILAQAFRRMVGKPRQQYCAGVACRLSDLRPGQSAIVTAVEVSNPTRLEQLITFGIVPGCRITLEQLHPTPVMYVGFTQLSVDHKVADCIQVRVL